MWFGFLGENHQIHCNISNYHQNNYWIFKGEALQWLYSSYHISPQLASREVYSFSSGIEISCTWKFPKGGGDGQLWRKELKSYLLVIFLVFCEEEGGHYSFFVGVRWGILWSPRPLNQWVAKGFQRFLGEIFLSWSGEGWRKLSSRKSHSLGKLIVCSEGLLNYTPCYL